MEALIEQNNLKVILFDVDGVFFDKNEPIEGTLEALDKLYERNDIQIAYLTNNTTKKREDLISRFQKHGLKNTVPPERFYATAFLAGKYIEQKGLLAEGGKLCVCGSDGIVKEF